ncbi:hypothetical protein PAV_1c05980 [Paenibacillus alvei DSM 29]|nr:hypothetical protein PAV_1c05980 [Paenibacillus alvei DSM 29]
MMGNRARSKNKGEIPWLFLMQGYDLQDMKRANPK